MCFISLKISASLSSLAQVRLKVLTCFWSLDWRTNSNPIPAKNIKHYFNLKFDRDSSDKVMLARWWIVRIWDKCIFNCVRIALNVLVLTAKVGYVFSDLLDDQWVVRVSVCIPKWTYLKQIQAVKFYFSARILRISGRPDWKSIRDRDNIQRL